MSCVSLIRCIHGKHEGGSKTQTSFAEFVFLGFALVPLEFVVKREGSIWGDLGGEEEKAVVGLKLV